MSITDIITVYTHVQVEIFIPEHDITQKTCLMQGRNYAQRKLIFQSASEPCLSSGER